MLNTLGEEIRAKLEGARNRYNRLVLVVGSVGTGKTTALRALCDSDAFRYVNLNLEVSRRLLEYPSKVRPLRLRATLDSVIVRSEDFVAVLDNTEILFDPRLKQDPLRLLQLISRNRTIVASWNGDATGRTLSYAAAGHPEHRRYLDVDTVLIRADRNRDASTAEGDAR